MNKTIYPLLQYMLIASIALFGFSCSEEEHGPLSDNGTVPDQVTNLKVIPSPGGSLITYKMPSSPEFLYVKALVYTPAGKVIEFNASSYINQIRIEGLGSDEEHRVELISMSKSGVASEKVEVKIQPLEPPYKTVARSLKLKETFGGINMESVGNTYRYDLAYIIGYENEKGNFVEITSHYNNTDTMSHVVRGIPSIERKFGVFIRDRWNHFSDTLYATLNPLYEEMLDKKIFKKVVLPGDGPFYENHQHIRIEMLWDDKYSQNWNDPYVSGGTNYQHFATANDQERSRPTTFAFDMGQVAKLSRIRVNDYYRYINRASKNYEIWGRADTPPSDGSWDGWILLGTMKQVKPSGLPGDTEQYGPGDADNWLAGQNLEFSQDLPAVRYIRIKSLEDWQGFTNWAAAELTMYGSPSNKTQK